MHSRSFWCPGTGSKLKASPFTKPSSRSEHAIVGESLRLRVETRTLFLELLRLGCHTLLEGFFFRDALFCGIFADVLGDFHVRSAINFAAVPHAVDAHDANLVGDFINHAVVAHSDAPVVLAACQLAATGRARFRRQCLNRRDDAGVNRGRDLSPQCVQAGRDT